MAYEYSNPENADDAHTLPDIEVFRAQDYPGDEPLDPGYYWWSCLPGYLPDGEPMGPFDSYDEALDDARGGNAWD